MYVNQLPIPRIPEQQQLPFEILVDCILFCREHGSDTSLASSADYLESVIDGLVFDLYFPDEMKAAHCYITDCVASTIRPFEKSGSIASNTGYITGLCELFRNDKVINYGLLNSRNIKEVRIVTGEGV